MFVKTQRQEPRLLETYFLCKCVKLITCHFDRFASFVLFVLFDSFVIVTFSIAFLLETSDILWLLFAIHLFDRLKIPCGSFLQNFGAGSPDYAFLVTQQRIDICLVNKL